MITYDEQLMLDAARRALPREACGYVFLTGLTVEVPNVAHHGEKFFIMDMDVQRQLYMQHGPPVGVWHSHPNGDPNPSDSDLVYHPEHTYLLIVADGRVHNHGIPGS